jgi:hypothetical protein
MRRYYWAFLVALTILGECTTIRKYTDKIIESRPPGKGKQLLSPDSTAQLFSC